MSSEVLQSPRLSLILTYSVDLDIEGGASAGYAAFVQQLRVHYAEDKSKKYYVTAAPQCPFPDAYLGPVLDAADVDAVYIQVSTTAFSATILTGYI